MDDGTAYGRRMSVDFVVMGLRVPWRPPPPIPPIAIIVDDAGTAVVLEKLLGNSRDEEPAPFGAVA